MKEGKQKKFVFVYTDGTEEVLEFDSVETASYFANMEGDHLISFEELRT